MATFSPILLTLDMTILNLFMKSLRGLSSFWYRLQRSTSEFSLSMNVEYCLRKSKARWQKFWWNFSLGEKTFECRSVEIFDKEAAIACVSFVFPEFDPTHHNLEGLQMLFGIHGAVVHGNFDLFRVWDFCLSDVSGEVFRASSRSLSISGVALVALWIWEFTSFTSAAVFMI